MLKLNFDLRLCFLCSWCLLQGRLDYREHWFWICLTLLMLRLRPDAYCSVWWETQYYQRGRFSNTLILCKCLTESFELWFLLGRVKYHDSGTGYTKLLLSMEMYCLPFFRCSNDKIQQYHTNITSQIMKWGKIILINNAEGFTRVQFVKCCPN